MRYLRGGVFEMGSEEKESALGNDSPVHKVELSPFYIGEYPVMQALWKALMGLDNNPSQFIGDRRPVERVSWMDIVWGNQDGNGQPAFLQKLNEFTATTRPAGYIYRLPTEAEWEYAARGGAPYEYAGSDQLKEVGWYTENSHSETKAVGLKSPNEFLLYDISGNVREWCMDEYSDSFYREVHEQGLIKDPLCEEEMAQNRVLRGGSWNYSQVGCGVSCRIFGDPTSFNSRLGFRLVLAPVQRSRSTERSGRGA